MAVKLPHLKTKTAYFSEERPYDFTELLRTRRASRSGGEIGSFGTAPQCSAMIDGGLYF